MSSSNNSNTSSNSRPGRPRLLDEIKQHEVCALVTMGCSLNHAARYVGCVPSTIRREARRNPKFNEQLRRASFSAAVTPLQAVREASKKYWRAAAWLLERIDPERFGKPSPLHIRPNQLEAYHRMLADLFRSEIRDPEDYQRVVAKLGELSRVAEREAWANRNTIPEPSRQKKNRARFEYLPDDPRAIERRQNAANQAASTRKQNPTKPQP
jgi:IS30 family transposase